MGKIEREPAHMLEVRYVGNSRYAVFDGDTKVSRPASRNQAETAAHKMEQERQRKAPRERTCLCCERPFMSEGIHNRLCDPCRAGACEFTGV